jgi:hypothetical protein
MQRRNFCRIFDPAWTLCHNEGKTCRFSIFEKSDFVQRLYKISFPAQGNSLRLLLGYSRGIFAVRGCVGSGGAAEKGRMTSEIGLDWIGRG